jgi:hypothetical protein
MTTPAQPANVADDFEAAKTVVEKLKDLPRERQERVLRWVTESLGITNPVVARPSPAPPNDPPAPAGPTPPTPPRTANDIRSFVAEKQPKTDIQYVTVAAYYYRFEAPEGQRKTTIDSELAQESTRHANYERLSNPGKTLNNAKRQGYLNSRDRGQFEISTVGENLVARGLPAQGASARTAKRPAPKKSKKAKAKAAPRKRKG